MLDTFIHKTVNHVFNCENIGVSVPEMVELIQTKIINEATGTASLVLRQRPSARMPVMTTVRSTMPC